MSEETVQILYTGEIADGTDAKLEEMQKQLCEKLGISVEFLTGDVHVSEFSMQMAEAEAENQERIRKFNECLRATLDKSVTVLLINVKRASNGLGEQQRAKHIRAMRAGKDTCFRGSSVARARRQEAAKEMAWVPETMRRTWPLW